MIKQKSFLRLHGGSLGETTFFKSVDGYRVQEKKVVPAGKFKNDPSFQWARNIATEFTRAASGGKTMRFAFKTLVDHAKDKRVSSRLTSAMRKVINGDTINQKGQRNLVYGNTALLEMFQFNGDKDLQAVFKRDFKTTVDRVSGHLTVDLPILDTLSDVKPPHGTTHFQIVTAASEVNFESTKTVTDYKVSAMFPYNSTPTPAISNLHTLEPNSTNILVIVAGIRFYRQFNGVMNPLNNDRSNALSILRISKV